jgi:hypothetical protein
MAEGLTRRQRYWLKHIQRAEERGETLKAYAKRHRLSIGALYHAKSQLMKFGALPRCEKVAVAAADFVPVRLEPLARLGAVCRIRYAGVWEVECEVWPDPQWLAALMQGAQGDASA